MAFAAYSPVLLVTEDHFVTSSYLDPLTGLLFLVGMASALWLVRKDAFVAFLTVGLAWLLFFAGATHDREFPPTTRMFLMLPVLLPIATSAWRASRLSPAAPGLRRAAPEGSSGRRWPASSRSTFSRRTS